jgi:hypothetical protein
MTNNLVHCKFDSESNSVDLYGLSNFKIWLKGVPVSKCDDFEACLTSDTVKTILSSDSNSEIKWKDSKIKVTDKTKTRKTSSQYGIQNAVFDTSFDVNNSDISIENSLLMNKGNSKDIDTILLLSKYANGTYTEILYYSGYFICMPGLNAGSVILVKSELDYGKSFSIPIEVTKILSNISKALKDEEYSVSLFVDSNNGNGVLSVDDFFRVQFSSNVRLLELFENRNLDHLLSDKTDTDFISLSKEDISEFLLTLNSFRKSSSDIKIVPIVFEFAEEISICWFDLDTYTIQYTEFSSIEESVNSGDIFKFNLSDSVIVGFDFYKALLDQKRIENVVFCSRQNGNQLVMKSENRDFFFSCASRRDNMYREFIEKNNVRLKDFLKSKYNF